MSNRDVPAWLVSRIAVPSSLGLTNFVADDAANGSTVTVPTALPLVRMAPDGFALTAQGYGNPRIQSVR